MLLHIAQARAFNPISSENSRQVRIVLDSGSQNSYATERVTKDPALVLESQHSIAVTMFGSNKEQSHNCALVKLSITLGNGSQKQLTLLTASMICKPLTSQLVTLCQDAFKHIVDLTLADPVNDHSQLDVDILIGSDQYWELATSKTCRGAEDQSPLMHCLAGYYLDKPPPKGTTQHSNVTMCTTHVLKTAAAPAHGEQRNLDNLLQRFWDLESLGITETERTLYNEHNQSATQSMFEMGGMRCPYP